jgi:hypothetical protein
VIHASSAHALVTLPLRTAISRKVGEPRKLSHVTDLGGGWGDLYKFMVHNFQSRHKPQT